MTDFASIGIEVRTTQLVELVSLLNKVVDGSTKAESATVKLNTAFSNNKSNVEQSTSSVKQYSSILDQANQAIKRNNDLVVNYATGQVTSLKAVAAAQAEIVKYQTQISQGLSQSGKFATDFSARMVAGMGAAGAATDKQSQSVKGATQTYNDLVAKLTLSTEAYRAQELALKGLNSQQIAHIQALESGVGKQSHFNLMLERTLSIITAMAAYRTLSLVIGVPGEILKTNMELEKLKMQLEGVTGSVQAAKLEYQRLLELDFKTPFDIEGLTQASIMLRNYGLEPTDAVLKSLTDSVAKLGGGSEKLIGIGRQLGQAWAKDKLQLMDMRPMIENGLPVISLLGKALGKSAAEILNMSHAGTIGRAEMLKLFDAMQEWAPDGSLRLMKTMSGELSNVVSAWQQLQDAMLQTSGESAVKSSFHLLSEILREYTNYLNEASSAQSHLNDLQKEANNGQVYLNMQKSNPMIAAITHPLLAMGGYSQTTQQGAEMEILAEKNKKLQESTNGVSGASLKLASELKLLHDAEIAGIEISDLQSTAMQKAEESYMKSSEEAEKWYEQHKNNQGALEQYIGLLDLYGNQLAKAVKKEEQLGRTDAQKEIEKLTEKLDKLTLSAEAFNKKYAPKSDGTKEEIKRIEELNNRIDTATETQKRNTKAKQEAEAAIKKLTTEQESALKASDKIIYDLMNEAELRKVASIELPKETEMRSALSQVLDGQKDTVRKLIDTKYDELKARKLLDEQTSATNSAVDAEVNKYNELTMSVHDLYVEKLRLAKVPEDQIPALTTLHETNVKLDFKKKEQDDAIKAMQSYGTAVSDATNKFSDLNSVTSAVFDGALGGVNLLAGAFDNLIKSIANTAKEQEKLNETRKNLDASASAINDPRKTIEEQIKLQNDQAKAEKKYANDVVKLNQQITIEKLSGARQVAGAISGMLDKNTSEYKAAHAVEMALAGAELAMQVMKVLGIGAVTAANVESVVPYVGATMTKAQADALGGVVNQSSGDPYTAFPRMAMMAAIMAALGFAVSSFGSGKSSITTMGPQGISPTTGTILGDSTAQSESIDKTYQLLKDIHADEYATLRSIDRGISDLHSGITDVITRLYQAGGLTQVTPPSSQMTGIIPILNSIDPGHVLRDLDPIGSAIMGALFGGEQTSTVTAQGIATSPTLLSDIISGKNLQAQQFAQIETKTDGGWFGSDEFSFSTQYSALDSATQNALNGVFKSMGNTMFSLADNLGMGLSDRVKNYIIPPLTVDLKGLDGEAAAKKLNGVLSAALDTMSTTVFGDILGQYQQLGEGMLETAVRIVSEVAVVKDALNKSGLSISGDAIALSDALVQAAGGLQEFQKAFDNYYQKFYTDAERNVFTQQQLNSQLSDVNLLLPTTRDGYRQLVEALNINNAADQQRYSLLLKLSGAADTYYSGVETAAKAAQQIADQQRALDIQLMEASGRAIEALTAKRKDELAAMDASLRFSQQAIWAMASANDAVTKAVDSVSKSISNLTSLAAKLRSALSSTAVTSDALTRQERLSAQSVLQSALIIAKSGGSIDNLAGMDKALTDIAKPSEQLYSTFVDYARDQGRTGNTISQLADYADTQVSMAQQQLDAVNGTTSAVLSVKDAVSNLSTALNIKAATLKAIDNANAAIKVETSAKTASDAAAAQAALSAQKVSDAIATANNAAQAASTAQAHANALANTPAPTTYRLGETNNALWEQELKRFIDTHVSVHGFALDLPWGATADTRHIYPILVDNYNKLVAEASSAAYANAAALESVANAAAALIPSYQATAEVDQLAASQASASYATALAYATAAKNAVPGINSFAIGTDYVESDRLAMIHSGERVMPAADNREIIRRMSEPRDSSNNELIFEVKKLREEAVMLREEVVMLRAETRATVSNTSKTAKILERVTPDGNALTTIVLL